MTARHFARAAVFAMLLPLGCGEPLYGGLGEEPDALGQDTSLTETGEPIDSAVIEDTSTETAFDSAPPPDTTTPPPDTAPPTCQASEKSCSGACTVTREDPQNCGGCGNTCANDEWCRDTACACRPPLIRCGTACIDRLGDHLNCGSCGNTCGNNHACVNGACVKAGCPFGRTPCPAAMMGKVSCFDLWNDATHCGACGRACNENELCIAGMCTRYGPAPGCSTCGGCGACSALFTGGKCCPPLMGHSLPTCIAGAFCP